MEQLESKYSLPQPPAEAHYTVYKLTDPEGKIYIGCTGKPVEKRWKKGRNYNYQTHISRAIRAIGWENFEKKVLCEKLTRAGAEKLEKWFIAYYDSANPEKGYNRALGGLGKGTLVGEATRKLQSDVRVRMYEAVPEYRERVSKGVREAYENDPGYRERVSKGHLAAYENDPEYSRKKALSRKMYYRAHPEEREAVRRRMKEYLSKPENRAFVESDTRPKPVICVETGAVYRSQYAAERATGFTRIHDVCLGRYCTAGGYHWRYTGKMLLG